jgi:hypothetical protein
VAGIYGISQGVIKDWGKEINEAWLKKMIEEKVKLFGPV